MALLSLHQFYRCFIFSSNHCKHLSFSLMQDKLIKLDWYTFLYMKKCLLLHFFAFFISLWELKYCSTKLLKSNWFMKCQELIVGNFSLTLLYQQGLHYLSILLYHVFHLKFLIICKYFWYQKLYSSRRLRFKFVNLGIFILRNELFCQFFICFFQ